MNKLLVTCCLGFILTLPSCSQEGNPHRNGAPLAHYVVEPSDLSKVIKLGGEVEAQQATILRCEVENLASPAQSDGTQIIFLVSHGVFVKEGDLLVELDSTRLRKQIDITMLDVAARVSTLAAAISAAKSQRINSAAELGHAKLRIELAELDLEMYVDEQNGTLQLARDGFDRQIDNLKNRARAARAGVELHKSFKSAVEELAGYGIFVSIHIEHSRYSLLKANNRLEEAVNRLETYRDQRRQLEKHEAKYQRRVRETAVMMAKQNLEQVIIHNHSIAEQLKAVKGQAEKAEQTQQARVQHLQVQLDHCKIYAPKDGLVMHAREARGKQLEEGAQVRQRQPLVIMPDLSQLQVKTEIQAEAVDLVHLGDPATVRVVSLGDQSYEGVVHSVASVPSASALRGAPARTYETIVHIHGDVPGLLPTMAAEVEIYLQHSQDVLAIPVQAVEVSGTDVWCYLDTLQGVERRMLKLGASNGEFVQILEGIAAGDRVILEPNAILDAELP